MTLDTKIAYIDLTTGEIEVKPIPPKMIEMFLGSRGLDAYLMYNHIKPGIDPLGADNVVGVTMPSRFNLAETRTDALRTAENLGMSFHTAPMEDALGSFDKTLELFEGWDN